jgi:hypothetical protein
VPYELLTGGPKRLLPGLNPAFTSAPANVTTDIGPRRDKRNLIQIYAALSLGSVRVQVQVVTIDYTVWSMTWQSQIH